MDARDPCQKAQARTWADKLKAKCSARKQELADRSQASKAGGRREAP